MSYSSSLDFINSYPGRASFTGSVPSCKKHLGGSRDDLMSLESSLYKTALMVRKNISSTTIAWKVLLRLTWLCQQLSQASLSYRFSLYLSNTWEDLQAIWWVWGPACTKGHLGYSRTSPQPPQPGKFYTTSLDFVNGRPEYALFKGSDPSCPKPGRSYSQCDEFGCQFPGHAQIILWFG